MSDFDVRDIPPPPEVNEEPIPFDDDDSDEGESSGVSHSPLTLGPEPVKIPETKPSQQPAVSAPAQQQAAPSAGRITGCKTFFTKLHPGAIEFLDGQITEWIKKNPDKTIKSTNSTVGEVQAKKTEQNLIVTIWF
ncbi:MAG: hypothetical protein ACYSSP_12440 [Planctomycetota bacterium]|jgi:hypothetical protein